MPIYEYRCEDCGHELEALQKLSDAALTDCPECGKPALKKQVSAPGFRLSGSGWYETDFKSGNQRNIADKGGSGDSKSSDSAPAPSCCAGSCGCG
jgi:putative FmdB family regulatory protein